MKKLLLFLLLAFAFVGSYAQAPSIQWQKSFGGEGNDYCYSIQQTSDTGFIITGTSNSIDGDVTGNHGDYDVWVLKLNSSGTIQWQNRTVAAALMKARVYSKLLTAGLL